MGQNPALDTKNSEIGVMDSIGEDMMKSNVEQLKREVELFKQNLIDVDKGKEDFLKQWEIDDEVYHIVLDNYRKVEPEYVYEKSDRYWELKKKQLEYKYRMDKHGAEARLKQFDIEKEAIKEQLKSSEDKLNDIEGN